jgi:segregation and condensation protein B
MTDPTQIDTPESEGPETDEEAAALEAAAADEPEDVEEQDEAEIDEVEPAILTLAGAARLIEAVLFASSQPVAEEDLAERLPEGTDLQAVLAEIAALYDGRGVTLVRIAGRWAFRTAPDLAPALQPEQTVQRKLSRAAVETLAIIAYHQPITRAEIEQVRGVALSKGTLDMLMEAGWIKPKGRRQAPGRPVTWVTTDDFLLHFGLDKIEDLPNLEELRAAGLLDKSMGIATIAMRQEEADAVNSAASKEHDEEDARIRQERQEASAEEAAKEERELDAAAAAKAAAPAEAEAMPDKK